MKLWNKNLDNKFSADDTPLEQPSPGTLTLIWSFLRYLPKVNFKCPQWVRQYIYIYIYIARTCYICFVKYVRGTWGPPKSSSCTEFRSGMGNSGQKCMKFQNRQPLQVNLMNKYCVAYSLQILENSCQSRPLLNPHERMDADSHPCLAQMWVPLQLQFKW